tara:strand:+ start:84 stop:515 length:432 start_codon:yes stop_codon:yes gene_type:complete
MDYIILFLISIVGMILAIYITGLGGIFSIAGILLLIISILQALQVARLFIKYYVKVETAEEKKQKRLASNENAGISKNATAVMESEISIMPSSLLKKNKELNKLGLTKKKKLFIFLVYFNDFYPTTFTLFCLSIFSVILITFL